MPTYTFPNWLFKGEKGNTVMINNRFKSPMKLVLANNTWQRHKHVTACDHAVGFVTKSLFISINSITYLASKGWQSGESICFPPMWPEFKSRRRRHMWVEFVAGSLLCSERFFSGYSGFPLSSKLNISKLQFNQESGR